MKQLLFALAILTFIGCTKKEKSRCYRCATTVTHVTKSRVGNEVNGFTKSDTLDRCFADLNEKETYQEQGYYFKVVGDSIFSQKVSCN